MTAPDPTAAHLLIVEDDQGIRDQLRSYLTRTGYRCSAAPDGESAIRLMQAIRFDLLIIDVLMPGMDGRQLARQIRQGNTGPIIMLTALDDLDNILAGFDAGADDYLTKPFEPKELVARIEALLRRAPTRDGRQEPDEVAFGSFRFDIRREELWQGDSRVQLTEKEVGILKHLARTPNRPVNRLDLMAAGDDNMNLDHNRAVDVRISRLRQKIEDDPRRPRHLVTVRGRGYRLITG